MKRPSGEAQLGLMVQRSKLLVADAACTHSAHTRSALTHAKDAQQWGHAHPLTHASPVLPG